MESYNGEWDIKSLNKENICIVDGKDYIIRTERKLEVGEMSIHINAKQGAIASKVLMPGDPLRAKFIAETFLQDAICYNGVGALRGFGGNRL